MQNFENDHSVLETRPSTPGNLLPLKGRLALTPTEFASLFGKSATWGYRQLYAGRVKALTIGGRLLIPTAEIELLLAGAAFYDGDPQNAPKARKRGAN